MLIYILYNEKNKENYRFLKTDLCTYDNFT